MMAKCERPKIQGGLQIQTIQNICNIH